VVVVIREISERDRIGWLEMRTALWPGSRADHDVETRRLFEQPGSMVVFVAEVEGSLVGFLELDFRKYAPGCESSPVPFIEGWYVDAAFRKRGVGRALVRYAEDFARKQGFREIGSDTEIENAGSIAAHAALGYGEVERVVAFRRTLDDMPDGAGRS
jgi:aminoglycoside 6'-N-acetyltransferase I